jgi:hypothetical protein
MRATGPVDAKVLVLRGSSDLGGRRVLHPTPVGPARKVPRNTSDLGARRVVHPTPVGPARKVPRNMEPDQKVADRRHSAVDRCRPDRPVRKASGGRGQPVVATAEMPRSGPSGDARRALNSGQNSGQNNGLNQTSNMKPNWMNPNASWTSPTPTRRNRLRNPEALWRHDVED